MLQCERRTRPPSFAVISSIPSRVALTRWAQTECMFRSLLLLLVALGPLWLVYMFGLWLLVAFVALVVATFLFSTGKARPSEEDQGGRLTGYSTTELADF
jgi:hypothetical protein